ncbi:hypothetical protein CEY02_18430 [Bacillus pumilus]|uniref:Uncharacterized protein n=1 Tax=Bacillus pumilus TaxID=1408 RepID=A0A2A5IMZ3_BACPU|nr:hypothetical protein CEY02_18430 [Bacillus pumilus]
MRLQDFMRGEEQPRNLHVQTSHAAHSLHALHLSSISSNFSLALFYMNVKGNDSELLKFEGNDCREKTNT